MTTLTMPRAVTAWIPVLNPETGERSRVSGYVEGTGTRRRRVDLMRAVLERAVENGAQFNPDAYALAMSSDDEAYKLAQRYTGTATGLILKRDGETWGYSHDAGGGGSYPMSELVILGGAL